MAGHQLRDIRRAQKETHLMRQISKLVLQITLDEPSLQGVFVSRVKLSPDKSICTVYFDCAEGKEAFHEKLGTLILYKPSIRSALSKIIESRYSPDLVFQFDELSEKQKRIEELLHKISSDN